MTEIYHEDLLAELDALHNVGSLEEHDLELTETNASCGDVVTFQIKLEEKNGVQLIKAVKWRGHGCAISQVSCSLFSERIKGKSLEEVREIGQAEMEQLLGITDISVGRIKCLLLPVAPFKKTETKI